MKARFLVNMITDLLIYILGYIHGKKEREFLEYLDTLLTRQESKMNTSTQPVDASTSQDH